MKAETITYEDFDLRLAADGDAFVVSAERESQVAHEAFALDLTRSWDLIDLEHGGDGVIEQRGAELFDALVHGRVRDLYQQARGAAGHATNGLRIRIHFDTRDTRLRPLLSLPWEIVFDNSTDCGGMLALDPQRTLVRVIDSVANVADTGSGPIERVLLAVANGPMSKECAEVQKILAGARITPNVLTNPTRLTLLQAISDDEPQIVHFSGHGTFDDVANEGTLVLSDEFGREDPLRASELAVFFAGRRRPRLVILSACHTAAAGRESGPFASTAAALVAAGLPAVIAMQSEIFDRNAVSFASQLYRRLVRGDPVEAAVASARHAAGAGSIGRIDWASPVLFMRGHADRPPFERADTPAAEVLSAKQPRTEHVEMQFNTGYVGTMNVYRQAGDK